MPSQASSMSAPFTVEPSRVMVECNKVKYSLVELSRAVVELSRIKYSQVEP